MAATLVFFWIIWNLLVAYQRWHRKWLCSDPTPLPSSPRRCLLYPLGGTTTPVAMIANVPTPGSTKVALQVISLPARPVFWPKVLVDVSGLPPSGVKVPVNEVST